jgi:hypothetical protein
MSASSTLNALTAQQYDVIVAGDEIESIITAVSAAKAGASVLLLRHSNGILGGLSTRGGLSYMDITPAYCSGLFQYFLQQAGVVRVALNPDCAHAVLTQMLNESGVDCLSGVQWETLSIESSPLKHNQSQHSQLLQHNRGYQLSFKAGDRSFNRIATVILDATPDATLARAIHIPHLEGLGGLFGKNIPFLGVTPVFRITGVTVEALQAFEASIRNSPDMPTLLEQALPYHPDSLRAEYINRPTYAPANQDYLDILNPAIGIHYHQWRHQTAASYPEAMIAIDGGNIARLADGSLGFNGMVAQAHGLHLTLENLIHLSQGGATPNVLLLEMQAFETYLRTVAGFENARIVPPDELYVRQTVTLLAASNMTALDILRGGVFPTEAIGSFSYWLDLRGVNLLRSLNGNVLPKPHVNLGLKVCLPAHYHTVPNFGFVSRSAGYSPLAQGFGRIVQHNAILGEALGIAAALAIRTPCSLADMVFQKVDLVKAFLEERYHRPLQIEGHPTMTEEAMASIPLLQKDARIVASFRKKYIRLVI